MVVKEALTTHPVLLVVVRNETFNLCVKSYTEVTLGVTQLLEPAARALTMVLKVVDLVVEIFIVVLVVVITLVDASVVALNLQQQKKFRSNTNGENKSLAHHHTLVKVYNKYHQKNSVWVLGKCMGIAQIVQWYAMMHYC